jgi:hypothetical protein
MDKIRAAFQNNLKHRPNVGYSQSAGSTLKAREAIDLINKSASNTSLIRH